jgi:hypothetical protein
MARQRSNSKKNEAKKQQTQKIVIKQIEGEVINPTDKQYRKKIIPIYYRCFFHQQTWPQASSVEKTSIEARSMQTT